jgi:anti-sigma-K factor RskA
MSETGDLDTLAAEYVLGTLDGPERAQAQAVLGVDEAFAAKVRIWERRLGELHLMVEPVEPDGEIWERIKGKMPAPEPSQEPAPRRSAPCQFRRQSPFRRPCRPRRS